MSAFIASSRKLTQVVGVLPSQAYLEVVVFDYQSLEPLKRMLALSITQTIDFLDVVANREDTFPQSHRICADHRMDCLEFRSNILWSAAWFAVKFKVILLC